jgi:hypothetical protein
MDKINKESDSSTSDKERAYGWAKKLCDCSKKEEDFYKEFCRKLDESEDIFREFIYYMDHQQFLCEKKICERSVIDILVWQIDHFKSFLDRGLYDMQSNPDAMLLMAFDTFLNMEQETEKYKQLLENETGTDYPGKF